MQHMIISGLAIVGTCLGIAVATIAIFIFRPGARRRRRHRRHSRRPRIDLISPRDAPPAPDA
ncbi:MAG TPA: hypothetical protein VF718_14740 [Allosphingosinicella sp.]|jgi:hypothetical protein